MRLARGARIAWVGDWGGHLPCEPGLLDVCRSAADAFTELGADVTTHVPAADPEILWRTFRTWRALQAAELAPLPRHLLKPEAVWEIEQAERTTALDVHAAILARDAWYGAVRSLFERFDAVLAPSTQVFPFAADLPWPQEIDGRAMDSYHRWMETVTPWSLAAVPVLGMPAGFDPRGLPAGVQLIGPPGGDDLLLALGREYEAATRWVARLPGLAQQRGAEPGEQQHPHPDHDAAGPERRHQPR